MKKFLSYVLTFALLFFISAAATISMAMGNEGLINTQINNSQQASSSSLFNGIIDTFTQRKKFNVKGYIKLEYNEQEIPVNLYVDIDISDVSNIKINGYLNVKLEDSNNVVQFSFFDNAIYLIYNQNNLKIRMQTINDLIDVLDAVVKDQNNNEFLESEDYEENDKKENADLLESLMPKLMEALDNMKELKLENGDKRAEIKFDDILKANIVTDEQNLLKNIEIETVEIEGYKLYADLNIVFDDRIFINNPETKNIDYFDVSTYQNIVNNLLNLNNFRSNISLGLNGKRVSFDVLANLEQNNYQLNLVENNFGYIDNLNLILFNNNIYSQVNDIKLLLNETLINELKTYLFNFIDSEEQNIDCVINNITQIIKPKDNVNVSVESVIGSLKAIKEFKLNDEQIYIKLDTNALGLNIGILEIGVCYQENDLCEINITGLNINSNNYDFAIKIQETEEKVCVSNPEQYFDIYKVVEKNKDYFAKDEYDIDLKFLSEKYSLNSNLKFDISEKYYSLDLELFLNGEYVPVEVVYADQMIFVKHNGILIKVSEKQFESLLGNIQLPQINIKDVINQILLNANERTILGLLFSVENIHVDGRTVELLLNLNEFGYETDASVLVILEDFIVKSISVEVDNNLSTSIVINSNDVQKHQVERNDYLDIFVLYNNLIEFLNSENKNINLGATLFDKEYNKVFGLNFDYYQTNKDENLLVNLFAEVVYNNLEFSLDAIYQNNTTYANFNGLKLFLETDRVEAIISILFSMLNENPKIKNILVNKLTNILMSNGLYLTKDNLVESYEKITIVDSKELINVIYNIMKNLTINSEEINLNIDGKIFGIESIVNVGILINENSIEKLTISKLKVDEYYVDFEVCVNTTEKSLQTISNKDKVDYINVENIVDVVESVYNTIKTKSLTGTAFISINNKAQKIELEVNYGIKLNKNNEVEIYLLTEIFGKSVKIYIFNNTVFVDVQGLKTKIEYNQILDLIDWFNKEFNLQINLNSVDTDGLKQKLNDIQYMLGVISTLDVSSLFEKIIFNENSLEVIVDENLTVFVNYKDLLNQIKVNQNNDLFEINIKPGNFNFEEVKTNEYVSYSSLIDLYNSIMNTINSKNNFDFTINTNINNENIIVMVRIDKDYNVALKLINNTYGYVQDLIITYINGEVYLRVNDVYVLLSDKLLADMPAYLSEIIKNYNLYRYIEKFNSIVDENKKKINKFNPILLLDYVKKLSVTETSVSVVIDSKELNLGSEIILILEHNKELLTGVNLQGINYQENRIGLYVDIKETIQNVYVDNAENYNDIYKTLLNSVDYYNSSEFEFTVETNVVVNNKYIPATANIKFNLKTGYIGIKTFINYNVGYSINLELKENNIYLNINNVKFKINNEQLVDIINSLNLIELYQIICKATDVLKTTASDISIKEVVLQVINSINYVSFNSNEIIISINKDNINQERDIVVQMSIIDGVIRSLNLTTIKVGSVSFNGSILTISNNMNENIIDANKYVDIFEFVNKLNYLINQREGEISLNINSNICGQNYIVSADMIASLFKEYFKISLNVSEAYDLIVNAIFSKGDIYAQVNDIFAKVDLETLIGLIIKNTLGQKKVDFIEIQDLVIVKNIKNFIDNFKLNDLNLIKELVVNSQTIKIIIDKSIFGGNKDTIISFALTDNLITDITIYNLYINENVYINELNLSVYAKDIVIEDIDEQKYLDVKDLVQNVVDLPNEENLNAILGVDFYTKENGGYNYELGFDFDFKKKLINQETLWSLITYVYSQNNMAYMTATYHDQAIFAEYNGLKLLLETDRINEIVSTILSILKVENNYTEIISRATMLLEGEGIVNALNGVALPKADLTNNEIVGLILLAIENLHVSSEGLNFVIDGNTFGFDSLINVNIQLSNNAITQLNVSKLTIGNLYVDITLDLYLEEQVIQKIPNDKQEYYINIADLTEAVESVYNTVTQDYITGNISLNVNILQESIPLTIYYGIGNNNGKFEVYVEFKFKDVLIRVIYQNGKVFVDIQGMKVQFNLNNINDITNWVENEFGIQIDEGKINQEITKLENSVPRTIDDIVKFISNLDLSFINKIEFIEKPVKGFVSIETIKTMIISLTNGISLSFDYGEKVENILVEDNEEVLLEVNVDKTPEFTENYVPEIKEENFSSYTNLTDLISLLKQTVLGHHNFLFDIVVMIDNQRVGLNIEFNVNSFETRIVLSYNSFGYVKELEICYLNKNIYIKINDLWILITEELIGDAPQIIDNILNKMGFKIKTQDIIDIVKAKVEQTKDINFMDYLKFIKSLSVYKNGLDVEIDASSLIEDCDNIEIHINHEDGEIKQIAVNGLNVNNNEIKLKLNVKHKYVPFEIDEVNKYIDIYKLLKENIEFFKTGELDLDVEFSLDSELDLVAKGNVKLDLNNREFGLRLDITGDYNLTLAFDYYNEVAYVSINGIKVQTTLDKVQVMLKEFGIDFDINGKIGSLINNNPNIDATFDEVWDAIEKLILTTDGLKLNLDLNVVNVDALLDLNVLIENYIAKEIVLTNFNVYENIINAKVVVNNNKVERNVINQNDYLDITETIINAKNLLNLDIINLLAELKIYDNDLIEKFGINLDLSKIYEGGRLNASALINLLYNNKEFNISTIYQEETWFANINKLKLFIEKDRIEETIQRILNMINKDYGSYEEIVSQVISLLENKNIYEFISELNIKLDGFSNNIEVEKIIKELLTNVKVSSSKIEFNVDGNIFGINSQINVVVLIESNNISSIRINKLKLGNNYFDIKLEFNSERKEIQRISNQEKESYVNIAELSEVAEATLKTFENKTISGFFTLGFNFAGERNLLNVNYGISFDQEKGYKGYIQTNFKGLDVNIYFIDNIIYLDIVGLKLHLTFTDINELMDYISKFGVEVDFDFTQVEEIINGQKSINLDMDVKSILDTLFNIDLGFINKALFTDTSLDAYFNGGLNIFVNYSNVVEQVIFRDGDIYVELNCSDFDDFALDINTSEFYSYNIVTDMIDSALELLKKKQVSMDAETLVYENNILADRVDIDLAINTLETLNVYAGVVVNNDKNTNIHFAYQDDYIFANYENLKLSLSQKSLKEILVIILEALGVDAKTIGFLGNVAEDMNLSTDNLEEIIPSLDFGNPLNMLKLIKSINIVDNEFIITLDGCALTGIETSGDMTLKVKAENNDISSIKLGNIYSNGEKQRFDLNINFKEYNGVKQITDKETYIDVSGCAGILKAFVNTSNLTDYSMSGTITVVANIIGINIDMDIPVEARVKIVDGEVVSYIVLDVPVIGSNVPGFTGINVNNDVPYEFGDTSVESRRLEMMYKDDFLYFYRKDVVNQTIFADRIYEKTLKLNANEMTSDLLNYLLSYGLGFSDTIMAEIDKAVVKATDREDNPLDISNVLKGFSHTDGTDLYSLLFNLAELANNEMLGDALINIYTINNESTSFKDYIGRLAFDINMPLASVCEIKLKTDNLTLNNIGKEVDVSATNNYVNNYKFKENQQYEKSGGDWTFAGEKQYTIKFVDEKGNVVNDITAPVETQISLPTLSTIVEYKEDGKHTYNFKGWYLSGEFKESQKVSYEKMPRGNRTLYAKWSETVCYYRNVNLNSMGGGQDSVIKELEGERFVLPTLENRIVVDGQTKITYGFTGWFIDEACLERATIYEIPSEDITLYAGWEEISRYVAYNLKVIDNGKEVFNEFIGEGLDVELSGFTMDSYTKFYLTQDWTNEYTLGKMPSNDLTLYVRNRYALNIVSAYGSIYDTTEYHYQGESYNLPSQSNYVVDNGNTHVTYTFNGWEGKTSVMPNSNLRVVASWGVNTKYYYTVTFKLCYNGNAAFYNDAKLFKNGTQIGTKEVSVKVLEGNMDLSVYKATWVYKAVFYYHYNFQGWSTSKNGSAITSVNITGNTTIYGLWSGLKTGKK